MIPLRFWETNPSVLLDLELLHKESVNSICNSGLCSRKTNPTKLNAVNPHLLRTVALGLEEQEIEGIYIFIYQITINILKIMLQRTGI